jgi:hypothetical protein
MILTKTMHELSNAAISEAISNGLDVQRVISGRGWDGRFVLIENRPCQIIKTRYVVSNPRSPKDVSVTLYLPRTEWPDFLIYVARREATRPLDFYIVPRGNLSKDTSWSPDTLEKYRKAWSLLKEKVSSHETTRRFTILSQKLKDVMTVTKAAGLEVVLIRPAKHRRWPVFLQTLVVIAGRRCSLHSFSRINSIASGSCVFLRKPKSRRAEFHLYMISASKEPPVYVFPRGAIEANTSVSLNNETLKNYRNNWALLAQFVDGTHAIEWNQKPVKAPKEPPIEIRETIIAAEKQGLVVERPHLPNQHQLYISKRRCQIVRAKPVVTSADPSRTYVPLNMPKSEWPEFVIFFSRLDMVTTGGFFIVPRDKLTKRTLVSPTSSWLRDYADAWSLL